jgi:sarcosine oxidase subunit alpha
VNRDLRVLPTVRPRGEPCTVDFEGRTLRAFEGEPLAVALFAEGVRTLARSPKFHRPRGAFCFDGHCGACLLRVDGNPNVRACMTPVRSGLRCEGQNAFPSTELDVLEVADWMFPDGLDHQTLMTGNRLANRFFVKLVRHMGGSGTLPDAAAPAVPQPSSLTVDVAVVGGGPAGLTAALTLRHLSPAAKVILVDEQGEAGGSWRCERDGQLRGQSAIDALRAAGVTVLGRATAIGYYPEDAGDGSPWTGGDMPAGTLAVISMKMGLVKISARRFLYATGAYDQNLPFPDNDRPGVLSARACGRLAFRHGISPGDRIAIVGDADVGARLAAGLIAVGIEPARVERVDPARVTIVGLRGSARLRGVVVRSATDPGGRPYTLAADVVAVATTPAPASELPRQHGADVEFDLGRGGFAVRVDAAFQTSAAHVYACGDVTGYVGPQAATEAGRAAGAAIARTLEGP